MIKILPAKKNGFTLLEITVVIFIFAIMAAITIPFINKFQPTLKLNSASRNLVADLRYAQQLTVTEQVPHLIYLDLADGSYQLLRVESAATTTIKDVNFPAGIGFELASTTISEVRFNSYGGVSAGSVGQIELINESEKAQYINIKPSGYVQLSN